MIEPKAGLLPKMGIKASQPSDSGRLLVSIFLVFLITGLLYYFEIVDLPFRQYYRYLTILPVCMLAYYYGLKVGLGVAIFFSTAFLPQLFSTIRTDPLGTQNIQIYAYILFINTLAYIIADIARSIRTHEALSSTVRDWEGLLARTSALDEVVKYILKQSSALCPAEGTIFLLRSPLEAHWEIVTLEQHIPLPPASVTRQERQSLAEWLLDQERDIVQNHLDQDDAIFLKVGNEEGVLSSLLALPLYHQDGTLMGVLVMLNKFGADFSNSDLRSLKDLIAGGEKALEQAGLYARTDYALAKRVRQLAAIQRTARELNATLDPRQIIERTLHCALEITDGEAGFISLDMNGFPPIFYSSGPQLDTVHAPLFEARVRDLQQLAVLPSDASSFPALLPKASSRLLAPIRRENQNLGLMLVESTSTRIFKEAARHVLTLLADHAATALENARLFQEIHLEQQRASLIVHTIADGLFTTDASGRVITFNPAAEQLTGWEQSESYGKLCCDIFGCHDPGDPVAATCVLIQAVREHRTIEEKYVIRQRSGTKRVISLSLAPLPAMNESYAGSVFLFRDITEQEEMVRLQRELVAAISHELRAPLSHISAIAETLMSEPETSAIRPYSGYFGNLMKHTQRLANFADRILDVYQMETGQMRVQLRPLPASLLVEEIIRQWRVSTPYHTFVLNAPEKSLWMWADENAFHTVLNNLLDNAVKYSPEGSPITVTIKPGSGGNTLFSVQDQGPGIAAEHQNRIFQMFYRVDGRDAQTVYGHGFGLYMAKNLIESMQGHIWVESEVNRGSIFTFSLPLMEDNNAGKDLVDRR